MAFWRSPVAEWHISHDGLTPKSSLQSLSFTDQKLQQPRGRSVVDLPACSSDATMAMRPPPCSVSNTKQQKMYPEEEELSISMAKITDDLVVEILSRLPYKSFCRFKCVCKSWLAFSSDPHYSQKLPKVPTGFFYQDHDNSAIQLVSLSKNDEGIDGTLSFLPHYEQLKFIDCCNGLVLCEYKSSHTSPDIFHFIVCNPATREWRILPDTQRKSDKFCYSTFLGFDPSCSTHFCVFNFHTERGHNNMVRAGTSKVEMFSSRDSMWHVYSDLWNPEYFEVSVSERPHVFFRGYLSAHSDRDVLVLEELVTELIGQGILPLNWTIKLPLHKVDCDADHCFRGCLGQSLGILHYAVADKDGCTILIWRYGTGNPNGWTVEHRLSMRDAFGRDDFVHYEDGWYWVCNYEIIAFDLERDALFLIDEKTNKLLSYSISTGKLNEITDCCHWSSKYYVACYSKIADLEPHERHE